jgi:hypothetical protein
MKKNLFLFFLALLLVPTFAAAGQAETIEIRGVVGDSAPQSRTYEVDSEIYHFDQDIVIQNESGESLTFAALKGGAEIKIIGEKISEPKSRSRGKIKYTRIIVLN